MITPGKLDLVAQRWTPFIYKVDFEGYNFGLGNLNMHVRLYPDAPGSPVITLANAGANAEGLSTVVIYPEDVGVLTTVQIRIHQDTLNAILLNQPGKAGKDVVLAYDLHILGGGVELTRWLEGSFTIRPGSTQP